MFKRTKTVHPYVQNRTIAIRLWYKTGPHKKPLKVTNRMKRVLLSLLLIVFFIESRAQKEGSNKFLTPRLLITSLSNNTINNSLFGNVLSVKEKTWYTKLSKGRLVKSKIDFSVYYRYDSLGNELLKIEIDNDGWYKGDTIRSAHGYKYDSAGHILEMYTSIDSIANDMLFYTKTVFKYNGKGEVTEEDNYDENSRLESKSVFTYDSLGNLISDEYHGQDSPDKESEKTVYRYSYGRLSQITCFNPANILFYIITIKYDQAGNKIESFKEYKNRKNAYVKIVSYDKIGNVVNQTMYSKEGKVIWSVKHRYGYDSGRNWITEYYYVSKERTLYAEREIEYYPNRPE